MRRFFRDMLPNAAQPLCTLSSDESHHIFRVNKIAQQEEFVLFNGQGDSCVVMLAHTVQQHVVARWQRDLPKEAPQRELWLCLCLLKQQAWSTALRMATELGVTHIVPIRAQHSIQRQEKKERWMKIILSAAKQSGRTVLPILHDVHPMHDLSFLPEKMPSVVLCPQSSQPLRACYQENAILIGPEGGYTEKERTMLAEQGWEKATLPSPVLRADTAVAAALSVRLLSES